MTLLDTHALIWLTEDAPELGVEARRLADEALGKGDLCVSAITFWEVAMLRHRGRISFAQDVSAWRDELLESGLEESAVDGSTAIVAAALADFHGDPADRIIVATASRRGATLVTADHRIRAWQGELHTHDARR